MTREGWSGDTRARRRAELLARRRRRRTRLPLEVALRLAMDPAMRPRPGVRV
ncbi:hypothetical protein [Cellulomonas sp. C5510]|uniref:hypothetical protein n=1 Tax=Cellulomonas sp. C5510 TaxID=2871170 RepID=UPI001C982DCF|nr:hypothetical protein [Cellulomonas sp. C5510]QZN84174.1 hypothetical protein K5O09_09685 [Cellulomonas sp. C5510]